MYNVENASKVNIISKIEYFMKCMKVSQSNRNRNFFIFIYREEYIYFVKNNFKVLICVLVIFYTYVFITLT